MDDRILEHYLDEFQSGMDLMPDEAELLLDTLISSSDAELIASVLSAWNGKGTTEDELFTLTVILRNRMARVNSVHQTFVDTVGTGGSSVKTFNVSTAAAFVVAGAGVPIAKHGNRAATSNSGSSDVLSALGVEVDRSPAQCEADLNAHGICFMFAPRFHSLSPTLSTARRSIGRPTIFNSLGPLCNPASAPHLVIGVSDSSMVDITARVLARLGTEGSWIVSAENGLDEIAIAGTTNVAEVNGSSIDQFSISGADFGVYSLGKNLPAECNADNSSRLIDQILSNQMIGTDAERLVLVNAASALYVAGAAKGLEDAYGLAEISIRDGSAAAKLNALRRGNE